MAATLLIGMFTLIAGDVAAAAPDGPAAMERLPLLMPDDFSELDLVAWRVEPGKLDPNNPLIEGDMPWDSGGVGIHGSVFRDPIDSKWKAYLVSTPPEEFPEKQPENQGKPWASENHAHRRICLFESDDGVNWSRPKLSNVPIGEHQQTNIIFDVTDGVSAYSSILVDPTKGDWPYEMFVLRESWGAVKGRPPEGNGYYRYRSRDGRTWERVGGKIAGPMTGDLCFFYRAADVGGAAEAPATNSGDAGRAEPASSTGYVAYYRLGGPGKPTDHVPAYEDFPRRSCYRAVSHDGVTWVKDPLMVLTADDRDHRDTQYQECVPLRVPGGYVAMVTMYHPLTQTLDLRMAASRDGRQWWFPDRRPCLSNSPLGDYGGGMIWQSQNLIVDQGQLHVYFGGTEGAHRQISDTRSPSIKVGYQESVIDHGAHFLPFNAALCRASWQYDRLYALTSSAGGPTIGTATTKERELEGTELWLNVATRPAKKSSQPRFQEGDLHVELLDASGKPLPGFTRADCSPPRGDHHTVQVKWSGGDRAPGGARKARFYLRRAFLYGFEFRGGWQDHRIRQGDGKGGCVTRPALRQVLKHPDSEFTMPFGLVQMAGGEIAILCSREKQPSQGPKVFEPIIAFSKDGGAKWSDFAVIPGTKGRPQYLEWLGGGRLSFITEVFDKGSKPQRIFSNDYGRTWPESIDHSPTKDGMPFNVEGNGWIDRDEQGRPKAILELGWHLLPGKSHPKDDFNVVFRRSVDGGKTWTDEVSPPQWKFTVEHNGKKWLRGVSEGAIVRSMNGDLVAALRSDMPPRYFDGPNDDSLEGTSISISRDDGKTWSEMQFLFDAGRHHANLQRLPGGDLVCTLVVRDDIQHGKLASHRRGCDALISHDHGKTWNLDRRYELDSFEFLRNDGYWVDGKCGHIGSVVLPDGHIISAYGQYLLGASVLIKWKPDAGPAEPVPN